METFILRGNMATLELGQVWNREAGSTKAFKAVQPTEEKREYSEVKYRVAFDFSTLAESTGFSAKLSARVGRSLKMDAMLSTARSLQWRSDSIHIVIHAIRQSKVVLATQQVPSDLTDDAQKSVKSNTFLDEYGNFFVAAELYGAALIATIGIHGVSEEVKDSLFASASGSYRTVGWRGDVDATLSRVMESSAKRGAISIDIFGAGGTALIPASLGAQFADALLADGSQRSLELTADVLRKALAEFGNPNADSVFGYEMIPIELKLKTGVAVSDGAIQTYVRNWDLVRQEKERVRELKLHYLPYWKNLREYEGALNAIEDVKELERLVEDLEEKYELDKGFDIKEQRIGMLEKQAFDVPPWELARWERPTAEVQYGGSHKGHHMSATEVKQAVPCVVANPKRMLLQIRVDSLPSVFDGDRNLNKPGAPWGNVNLDLTRFTSYLQNGLRVELLAGDASIPYRLIDEGRCIECSADLGKSEVLVRCTVDRSSFQDRLIHRRDTPLSLTYRFLPV